MKKFSKPEALLLKEAFRDLANKSYADHNSSTMATSSSFQSYFDSANGNAIDLNTFLKYFPLPGLHGERLFALFDTNHNGEIDEKEFIAGLTTVCLGTFEEKVKFMFKVYDLSNTEKISKDDLRTMLLQIPGHALLFLRNHLHGSEANVGISSNIGADSSSTLAMSGEKEGRFKKENETSSNTSSSQHTDTFSRKLKESENSDNEKEDETIKTEKDNVENDDEEEDPEWQLVNLMVEQTFAECDLDHDGKLSFDQFKMWVKQNKEVLFFMESVFPTLSTPTPGAQIPTARSESNLAKTVTDADHHGAVLSSLSNDPNLRRKMTPFNSSANNPNMHDDDELDEGIHLSEELISQVWQDADSRASTPHLPPAFMLLRAATPHVISNQSKPAKLLRTTSDAKGKINADHIESEYAVIVGESSVHKEFQPLDLEEGENDQDDTEGTPAGTSKVATIKNKARRHSDPSGIKRNATDSLNNSPAPYPPGSTSPLKTSDGDTNGSEKPPSNDNSVEASPLHSIHLTSKPSVAGTESNGSFRPYVRMGTLFKYGKRFHQLVARWYVLYEDDDILYHFTNRYDEFPAGVTFLDGCFIRAANDINGEGYREQNNSSSASSVVSRSASIFSLNSCRPSSRQSTDDENSGGEEYSTRLPPSSYGKGRGGDSGTIPPLPPAGKRDSHLSTASSSKHLYGIEIITPGANQNHKHTLYARTIEARNEWVEALRRGANVVSFETSYEILNQIGTGKYCKVFRCKKRKGGKVFAVKVIDKTVLLPIDKELLRSEIAILKMVKHPHILKLENSFETPEKTFIVTPFIQGGDLFDLVTKPGSPYQVPLHEDDIHTVAKPLIHAVRYLHSLGVVHRDLKPENILVGTTLGDIKLCDFGVSAVASASTEMNLPCGTLAYAAPEVLRGKYGREADMWSIGVIIYFLCCGVLPFNGQSDRDTAERIIALEPQYLHYAFKALSEDLHNLIRSLLIKNKKTRLTAEDAIRHKWFEGYKIAAQKHMVEAETETVNHYSDSSYTPNEEMQLEANASGLSTDSTTSHRPKSVLQTVEEEEAHESAKVAKEDGIVNGSETETGNDKGTSEQEKHEATEKTSTVETKKAEEETKIASEEEKVEEDKNQASELLQDDRDKAYGIVDGQTKIQLSLNQEGIKIQIQAQLDEQVVNANDEVGKITKELNTDS